MRPYLASRGKLMLKRRSRCVMVMTAPLFVVLVIFFALFLSNQTVVMAEETNTVLLQGLDKVTGRVSKFSQRDLATFNLS